MNRDPIKYYIHKLTHLRRDHKYGGAPHKPILILSIISNITSGKIDNERIYITPELVGEFKNLWSRFVVSDRHHCIFALPFYHMQSEGFWGLIPKFGYGNIVKSKIAMKSFSNLHAAIEYAQIDTTLFNLLRDPESRELLKYAIFDKYFPQFQGSSHYKPNEDYLYSIEQEIFKESNVSYKAKLTQLKLELKEDSFEEEVFVRSNIFKTQVPKVYFNTCAVSKLQINATLNVSMVDACHIVPFSKYYDDTITNGISLSPTIHRAFDRGLISIDNDYRIIVSDKFNEGDLKSKYSIKQYEGEKLLLPYNKKWYPDLDNLNWHRNNIFK